MQDARYDISGWPFGNRTLGHALPAGLMALLIGLLPGTVALAAPTTRPAAETVVRIRPTALVTGAQVTLADVAELAGDASALAAEWPIAAAPHAGSSGVVDAAHLQSVLSRRGVNLSNWIFRGASKCVVSRPGEPAVLQPARAGRSPAAANANLTSPQTPATMPRTDAHPVIESPGVLPGTLEAAIHDHLRRRLPDIGGKLYIRFTPATERLLTLSAAHYQFQITDRAERSLGSIPLEVAILENGKPNQVAQVVCEAALRREVIVARRNLNRGEILQAADLTVEERNFDRLEELGLTDSAPLLSQRARRMIRQGSLINPRDLEPVPLVARNDLVAVTVRRGGLHIAATARAMHSGCYGERIQLRSESSKEVYFGVITGPKAVEVNADPGIPALTLNGEHR